MTDFQTALNIDPDHKNAANYYAKTLAYAAGRYRSAGAIADAIQAYEACLERQPDNEEARKALAELRPQNEPQQPQSAILTPAQVKKEAFEASLSQEAERADEPAAANPPVPAVNQQNGDPPSVPTAPVNSNNNLSVPPPVVRAPVVQPPCNVPVTSRPPPVVPSPAACAVQVKMPDPNSPNIVEISGLERSLETMFLLNICQR